MSTAVFWLSVAALGYTFAGYPLLVGFLARWRERPVRKDTAYRPSVDLLIVARNEQARIGDKLACCLGQDYPADRLRVIVASDGSTDATPQIAEAADPARVRVLAFGQRRGKAACLNDAVAASQADIVVFCDTRQMLNPGAVSALVANFADPEVAGASGELMFITDEASDFGQGVDAYWRYEKFIRKSESRCGSVVGATGALYAIRRAEYLPIPGNTILDDVLIPMQMAMHGRRIVFEEQAHAFDRPATDAAREQLRKVRTLAGNFQLLALRPQLLVPWRNALFLPFVSHKVLRLSGPFALAGALGGSLANAAAMPSSPFWALAAASSLGLCASPLLIRVWPASGRLRLVRLASAFVWLNWFVVLGLKEFLTNRDAHLWKSDATSQAATGKARQP